MVQCSTEVCRCVQVVSSKAISNCEETSSITTILIWLIEHGALLETQLEGQALHTPRCITTFTTHMTQADNPVIHPQCMFRYIIRGRAEPRSRSTYAD